VSHRGFFAELARQSKIAARERARAQRIAIQEHNAAVRRAEQREKAAGLADRQRAAANEAERRALEKEAREEHIAAMEAEAEEQNRHLAEVYEEVESLLAASLNVDSYVDLNGLHEVVEHAPFDRPDLERPIPTPDEIPDPPEPIFSMPEPPRGLIAGLFGKAKYAEAVEVAKHAHEHNVFQWQKQCEQLQECRKAAGEARVRAEAERVAELTIARAKYAEACSVREIEISNRNKRLDELIANLGYGTPDAVQEYISIVLSNSVYPEVFTVVHEYHFEPASAELTLRVLVPKPGGIPEFKSYKYTKSADEITTIPLSQKICRDRYEGAIHQVALRSIHEVFESDRRGLIKTIRLEVGTKAVDPATGLHTYVPFVVVAAERESFLKFKLSAVIPANTLERLSAALSKNPYGLVPAETSGVRRS